MNVLGFESHCPFLPLQDPCLSPCIQGLV
jgi:hypothetical protein